MYWPDLSQYAFMLPSPLERVLNVGWLDSSQSFPAGTVSVEVIDRLTWLARLHPVRPTRGFHHCPFCGFDGQLPEMGRRLGMCELWIPRAEGFFAAPELVIHYIEAHQYRPPDAFVRAVEALDPETFSRDLAAEASATIAESLTPSPPSE